MSEKHIPVHVVMNTNLCANELDNNSALDLSIRDKNVTSNQGIVYTIL